jgi:5'-deoxynucleotidase YfbR-like HD superfamily hydrolase
VKKIFISHSSNDKTWIKSFLNELQLYGLNPDHFSIDEQNILVGDNIVEWIRQSLSNSNLVIFILSKSFVTSVWAKIEKDIAIKQAIEKGTKLIGIKIDEVEIDDPFLKIFKMIDFSTATNKSKEFKRLRDDIQIYLNIDKNISRKSTITNNAQMHEYLFSIYLKEKTFTLSSFSAEELSVVLDKLIRFDGRIKDYYKLKDNLNVFELVEKYLLESKKEIPLLIQGQPGTGKTSFLIELYNNLKHKNINGFSSFIPIYIDVEKYNFKKTENEALDLFREDITPIIAFLNNTDLEILFIVDGLDDYLKSILSLHHHILDVIEDIQNKKIIIGLGKTDHYTRKKNEISTTSDSTITFRSISEINQDEFDSFIDVFLKKSITDIDNDKLSQIKKLIKNINIESIDFFTVQLFSNLLKSTHDFSSIKTKSDLYEITAFKFIKIKDDYLKRTSKFAFDFYVMDNLLSLRDSNLPILNQKLIHSHISFRDYFIAKHIINTIIEFYKTSNDDLLEVFNNVYPSTMNSFCKEIANHSFPIQRSVLNGIMKAFSKVENIEARTHFCYLLGRFTHVSIQITAKAFLLEQKNKIDTENTLAKEIIQPRYLRFIRTIYISLASLGDSRASKQYIDILLENKQWDVINRGFHLEYYGDIEYDLADYTSLTSIDDGTFRIEKTFEKLHIRLHKAIENNIPHSLFNIELYTLCSLIQNRHLKEGFLDNDKIKKTISLINFVLDRAPNFPVNQNFNKYLRMLKNKLSDENSQSYLDLFRPIYRIKTIKRIGWNIGNRSVRDPETVASHMYGCILLARFFLADELSVDKQKDFPNYKKSEILEILCYHDLGEFKYGDTPSNIKTQDDTNKEIEAIEEIAMLSTYDRFGKLKSIETYVKNFENCNDDDPTQINYQIAKDIDQLEALLQLLIYFYDNNEIIPDFEFFFNNLYSKVRTEFGYDILKIICQPYIERLLEFPDIKIKLLITQL